MLPQSGIVGEFLAAEATATAFRQQQCLAAAVFDSSSVPQQQRSTAAAFESSSQSLQQQQRSPIALSTAAALDCNSSGFGCYSV
jgi:hypothetical protein